MEMKIVAAMCDENRGVGKDGHLPWPFLKEDIDHYLGLIKKRDNPKKKNIIIQGRITWEGGNKDRRTDPNAIQIVISSTYNSSTDPFHPIVVPSIEEAVQVALTKKNEVESIWVLGGQRVWEDAITHPMCKRIYLTRIYKDFPSDVFFPPFEDKFDISSDPEVDGRLREDKGIKFRFLVYDRKQ